MPEPIGSLLDSLGIDVELNDGELVSGALVLMKTVSADGDVALRIRYSDGLGYLERIGMLVAGQTIETDGIGETDDA